MNNTSPRTLLLLGALTLLAVGCAHENPMSIELEGNMKTVRQPGTEGGQAAISSLCTGQIAEGFRANGIWDLMVANTYHFFPRIQNNMVQQLQYSPIHPISSSVNLDNAFIALEANTSAGPLAGAPLQNTSWEMPFAAHLDSGAQAFTDFPLAPANVGDELRARFEGQYTAIQRVIFTVKVAGRMTDGSPVQSNTLRYPIDLCWGCLVSLPVAIEGVGVDPEQQYALCSTKTAAQGAKPPCMPGNDEVLNCGYYCYLCDQDNSCDDRFCPQP